MAVPHTSVRATARDRAAAAIAEKAADWPDMPLVEPELRGLTAPDAALCRAIVGVTLRRWLTLRHLLEQFLSKQLTRLEPSMQGILLTGSAQLLFLDGLPDYAVVDEMVHVSRRQVRPGAAGMTNAVLRKIARLRAGVVFEPWTHNAGGAAETDRLPSSHVVGDGEVGAASLLLKQACLPTGDPAALCNTPRPLFKTWAEQFGEAEAWRLAEHTTQLPPVVIAMQPGWQGGDGDAGQVVPHVVKGSAVWVGQGGELGEFLKAEPRRRVQDVAATLPVKSLITLGIGATSVLDYCGGRGTKTRQLRDAFPDARVTATDLDFERRQSLVEIRDVVTTTLDKARDQQYELILLDVPCSNTAVLARRPEARFRHSAQTLGDLVTLQRQIIADVLPSLSPGGILLYSTCSLEKAENHNQVQRLLKREPFELLHEHLELPQGRGRTYQDGGYHAVMRRTE